MIGLIFTAPSQIAAQTKLPGLLTFTVRVVPVNETEICIAATVGLKLYGAVEVTLALEF